jgi:hypothetical protein
VENATIEINVPLSHRDDVESVFNTTPCQFPEL